MLPKRLPCKYNIGFARAPRGAAFTFSILQGSWFHDSMHVESTAGATTSLSSPLHFAWSTSLHFHMFKHEAFAWNFIKLFLLMYSNSMQSCSFYFALHFFPALHHALQLLNLVLILITVESCFNLNKSIFFNRHLMMSSSSWCSANNLTSDLQVLL
jgi:hypothetical protein